MANLTLRAIVLAAGCLVPLVSEGGAAPKSKIIFESLASIRSLDDLQLSPDGKSVAYSVHGEKGVWVVSTAGEGRAERVSLDGFMPRWSPSGEELAYYSTIDGKVQLWIYRFDARKAHQVTFFKDGVNPDPSTHYFGGNDPFSYSWAPNGLQIVLPSRVSSSPDVGHRQNGGGQSSAKAPFILTTETPPSWTLAGVFLHGIPCDCGGAVFKDGKWTFENNPSAAKQRPQATSQLFVLDLVTRSQRLLTAGGDGCFNPSWSPDGKEVACASNEGRTQGFASGQTNIYLVDVSSGRKRQLTSGPESKWMPRWSPDGRLIAYLSKRDFGAPISLFVVSRGGGESLSLTANIERPVVGYQWTPQGNALVAQIADGVSPRIESIDPSNGVISSLTTMDVGLYPELSVAASGALAYPKSGPHIQGAIELLAAEGGRSHTAFELNPQIRQWQFGKQEVIRWKNGRGDEMEGVLLLPPSHKEGTRRPLIVDVYPLLSNAFKGYPLFGNHAWASEGYAVFVPNPRAPHSPVGFFKSEAFNHAARRRDGWDITIDDVMSGVDEIIRRGVADSTRMCLYGFSNGGGVVNYLVTRVHRFKCAVSVAPALSDWVRPDFLEPSAWIRSYEIDGINPYTDPDGSILLSAVWHANRARTPMLLAVGDEDTNSLLDAIEMYNGLRRFGNDVVLLRYPNGGHVFDGDELKDLWTREMKFFDKHLRSRPSAGSEANR